MGALQPAENIQDLSLRPSVADAYSQVSQYRDLLLLGDLSTLAEEGIADEMIQAAPTLTRPAQVALMTSILGLAMKLTGRGPADIAQQVPGGQITKKSRGEVMGYLTLAASIVDNMAEANNWNAEDGSVLQNMHVDLYDIINDY